MVQISYEAIAEQLSIINITLDGGDDYHEIF
jgi:hypothetical protein